MYKPNFCAECGERIERARWRWWTSEKFCGVCEKTASKANRLWVIGIALLLSWSAVGIVSYRIGRSRIVNAAPLKIDQTTSSVLLTRKKTDPKIITDVQATSSGGRSGAQANAPVYLCGARTKKGKPCSRRVSEEGARCWQHQGKRSILPAVKTNAGK